jgi:hypothetical protein
MKTFVIAAIVFMAGISSASAEPITLAIAAAVFGEGVVVAGSVAAAVGTAILGAAAATGHIVRARRLK